MTAQSPIEIDLPITLLECELVGVFQRAYLLPWP